MENQTCENCKYIVKHYAFVRDRFRDIHCPHCIYSYKSKIKNSGCCEHWEPSVVQEDLQKNIKNIIKDIYKRLDDICKVIETFNDEN